MPSPTQITVSQLSRLIGLPDAPVIIDVCIDEDFALDERLIPTAVSTGRRNTLISKKDWSLHYEVSSPNIFHQQAEVRDLGSMATRRVDELDWAVV